MPDRPLTILELTHQGGPAGSTQSIFGLSQHLACRGHRVVVGCREDTLLARLAREAALPVAPLAFAGIGALARLLAGVIARERVDVVNAHATHDRRALAWLRWRGALPQAFVVTRRTMPLTSPLELVAVGRSEEHTSELQSQSNLVCRLLLEKKNYASVLQSHRHQSRQKPFL